MRIRDCKQGTINKGEGRREKGEGKDGGIRDRDRDRDKDWG